MRVALVEEEMERSHFHRLAARAVSPSTWIDPMAPPCCAGSSTNEETSATLIVISTHAGRAAPSSMREVSELAQHLHLSLLASVVARTLLPADPD
jgi:hypothetical protein